MSIVQGDSTCSAHASKIGLPQHVCLLLPAYVRRLHVGHSLPSLRLTTAHGSQNASVAQDRSVIDTEFQQTQETSEARS
jgi:hypothetical protein